MRLFLPAVGAVLALVSPAAAQRPVEFAASVPTGAALIVPLRSAADLARTAPLLDEPSRAAVERALGAAAFDYKAGSSLNLHGIGNYPEILIVGAGQEPLDARQLQDLGGTAVQKLAGKDRTAAVLLSPIADAAPTAAEQMAVGAMLGGYSFDRYKSPSAERKPAQPLVMVGAAAGAAERFRSGGLALAEATNFSRDLIREPANALYPEEFVTRTRAAFRGVSGVTIDVLDVPAMERLGMGAILSVGKGSVRPPRLLVVRYRGSPSAPLVALAGKGITFDSGGISLKPGAGMSAMKGDMAGAASVVGAVLSLARSRAPVDVVALAALAENMPSGSATRPGDVVKAFNGKTIEVLNTDAEGRLVLADAVAYAERQFKPAAIVDIATLTGAVSTALGDEYAGLFSRNEALAAQLTTAGSLSGEEVWRLPLHRNYAGDMRSGIADIKNVVEGGGPGAGLGAHFIGEFVASTPWAHLDIASVDGRSSALPTVPEGLSGFGVRLLDRFVRDFRPVPGSAGSAN
nr:leucyl aminopeptidase [uncultured Sphingomonas sp.]